MRQPNSANLSIPTAEAMRSAGRALGNAVVATRGAALVIAIQGELGAGKTTLVSGVLEAMGIPGPTRSPTYTLIEPYEAAELQVYHLDLYRLVDAREVESLGIRDLLTADAVLLIEWPERGATVLPAADLGISITYSGASASPSTGAVEGEGRGMTLTSGTVAGQQLLQQLLRAVK